VKLDTTTALGIDIYDDRICMAVLKKDRKGVKLVKAVSGPVPEGAIKNGSVEDPAILTKGIKELKSRGKIWIRLRQAAVSLVTRPMLVQIIDTPTHVPTNVGQFVHDEMKRCIPLSGKKIAFDFCGTSSTAQRGSSRLFVTATDGEKVAALVKACDNAGVNLEAIEPPLLAYARAFYAKRIAGRFDSNVLLAILRGSTLTLCVFKKQALDFVRARHITEEKAEPQELCQWLAAEINAIIQFYGTVDVANVPQKWEVIVAADCVQLPGDAETSLKARVLDVNLQVRTAENAYLDTPIGQNGASGEMKVSVAAIGLAMKLLGTNAGDLSINLLPQEAAEVKSVRKHTLIAGNVVSVVLLFMILAVAGLGLKTEKVNANIARIKKTVSLQDINTLFKERELLDKQIERLSDRPGLMNEVSSLHPDINWAGLLNDIGNRTPKNVRIIQLFHQGDSGMRLEGLSVSYEAVHLFVDMLNGSKLIKSASEVETEKLDSDSGLITYKIDCSLALQKGK
jgi:Tfp pilus assembly protein PilN